MREKLDIISIIESINSLEDINKLSLLPDSPLKKALFSMFARLKNNTSHRAVNSTKDRLSNFFEKALETIYLGPDILKNWEQNIFDLLKLSFEHFGIINFFVSFVDNAGNISIKIFWYVRPSSSFRESFESTIISSFKDRAPFVLKDIKIENSYAFTEYSVNDPDIYNFSILYSKEDNPLSFKGILFKKVEEDLSFYDICLNFFGLIVESLNIFSNYFSKLESMSIKHETLPFYSTNFIKEYLKIDIEKSLRYKFYMFGVLLIKISNLEEIVSNHSELTRERIFTDIYFVLRSNIRRSDVYGFWDESSILISFSFIKEDTFNILEKRLREAFYSFPFKSYDNIKIDLKLEFKSLFFDPEKADKDKFLSELNEFTKLEIKEKSFDSTLLEKVDNLEESNIDIVYQPIYSIYNNAIFGYEAFLKLFDEEKYSVSLRSLLSKPSDTKKYTIEKIAIKKALNYFYKTFFLKKKTNLILFINVSILSIYKENILDYLLSLIKELGMNQDNIVIEINENDIIEHLYLIDEIAKKIKESNFSLSIDDFGSAFEPLTYLAKLSPSYVKLNNNLFFSSMSDNYKKLKLSSLIAISKDIGAKTVSKAIENESFYRFAKDMGIDLAQGYYLGYPTKELQLSQIDIDKISVYYQEVFELKEKREIGKDIKFQFYRKNEIIFPLRFLSLGLNYDLDLFILRALKELGDKNGFGRNSFIFVQLYSFSEDIIKELSNLFGKRLCIYVPLSLGTLEIINTYKILKKYDITLALFFDSSKVLEEEILNLKFDFVAISFSSVKLYDNVKEFFANFLNILSRFGYDKLIVKDVDEQEDANIINPFEKENKQFINYAQGLFFSKPKKLLEIKL